MYIKKVEKLTEVVTEDMTEAQSFDELTKKDNTRAFYMGYTFESAVLHHVLSHSVVMDILRTLKEFAKKEKFGLIEQVLREYKDCIDEDHVDIVNASNYTLTVLEREKVEPDDLVVASFMLGFSFGASKNQ